MSIGWGHPVIFEENTSFCLHLLIDKQIQDAADAAAGCQLRRQPDHRGEPREHQRLHVSPRERVNCSLRNINWERHRNGFYRSFSSLLFINHMDSVGPVQIWRNSCARESSRKYAFLTWSAFSLVLPWSNIESPAKRRADTSVSDFHAARASFVPQLGTFSTVLFFETFFNRGRNGSESHHWAQRTGVLDELLADDLHAPTTLRRNPTGAY